MPAKCPSCGATITQATLGEGWCECGKRLPAALSARAAAAPEPARPRKRFFDGSRLLLCLIGAGMIAVGVDAYRRSREAEVPPVEVELSVLEQGQEPPQKHIRFGRHVRLVPTLVYSYNARDGSHNPRVSDCLCPIVSEDNPWLKRVTEAGENAPEEVTRPRPGEVTVLLRLKSFYRVSDIPRTSVPQESATVFVSGRSLSDQKERELIAKHFPGIDTNRLMVLEERRPPTGVGWSLALVGGGVLMFIPMLLWMFWPRRGVAT